MASIAKRKSGNWKAVIRRKGWPKVSKTFRIKKDAEDWARVTEDKIVRGIYISQSESENMTISEALDRYLKEVTPTKKTTTQKGNHVQSKPLKEILGQYTLVTLKPSHIADYRDKRLSKGLSNNTVRLELALLSHLYTTAIKEWEVGLTFNPVLNVKKPSAGKGRNRRLEGDEEEQLFLACSKHTNPILLWVAQLALFTAMRKTEMLTLEPRNLNMDKRTVTLFDTKNNYLRTVPLTKKAFKVFETVLSYPFRPKDTQLLFLVNQVEMEFVDHTGTLKHG